MLLNFVGVEVDYALQVDGKPPGNATLRVCVMALTGDYPAQCEGGKFINGGIRACRRDDLTGTAKGDP